jgi:ketosteroid isomerase-like protein
MTELPERLHISFQDAFNRHDLDAIVALYEPGAVLVRFDGPVQGTDAIREAYRYSLTMRPTIDVRTLGVNRAGDLAMLHGKWILLGPGRTAARSAGRAGIQKPLACSWMGAGYS